MTHADVTKAMEGVTPGPWNYRPDKLDDWGVVKAGDFYLCQVRNPDCYTMEHLNQARIAKVDPREANARFIAWCREGVPALAAELAAMTARAEAAEAEADSWNRDYHALEKAVCGDTGLSAMLVATQAMLFKPRAIAAEAQVVDLRAKMEAMRSFIADFAAFKFDACYRHPACSPEDEGDDVTDAEPVWAWQEDARAALKAGGA
jgi:hypothetical protein